MAAMKKLRLANWFITLAAVRTIRRSALISADYLLTTTRIKLNSDSELVKCLSHKDQIIEAVWQLCL